MENKIRKVKEETENETVTEMQKGREGKGVNFINVLCTIFFVRTSVSAAFSSYMYIEKAAKMDICTKNLYKEC